MVALSVSISANTSPFLTVSPTFFCQPAITPSVIVSLKRGISTTSSIAATSSAGLADAATGAAVAVAGAGSVAGAAAGVPAPTDAISEATSSPALPIMASKSLTCNLPPFVVPICNKTPSW